MTSKIISYDLRAPGRNYDKVFEIIRSYKVFGKLTESTWFVKTDETCVQLRDKLLKHMDNNDRIFVAELTGVAAWQNAICGTDYLKKHL